MLIQKTLQTDAPNVVLVILKKEESMGLVQGAEQHRNFRVTYGGSIES